MSARHVRGGITASTAQVVVKIEQILGDEKIKRVLRERRTHRVLASSSLSMVFCLRSSSIRLTVTSFSRSVDSLVAIGGVTPRNLLQDGTYGIVSVSASSSLPLIVVHLYAGDEKEDLCLSCQSFVRGELEPGRESCGQARCQWELMSSSD